MTRRALLASTSLGVIAGGSWGASIQRLATPSVPSLSIIGENETQIALLDTTGVRALLLLGAPENDLQLQIPGMLSLLRQRVDLLVGTSSAVDALGSRFRHRWRVSHTLAIPDANPPSARAIDRTWVTQDLQAGLGNGLSLDLRTTSRGGWNAGLAERTLWIATILFGQQRVVLAPNAESLMTQGTAGASLVIVPELSLDRVAALGPSVIATNGRDDLALPQEGRPGVLLVRTYPQDIARFEFRREGLALPSWHEPV